MFLNTAPIFGKYECMSSARTCIKLYMYITVGMSTACLHMYMYITLAVHLTTNNGIVHGLTHDATPVPVCKQNRHKKDM